MKARRVSQRTRVTARPAGGAPGLVEEQRLRARGCLHIAGIDEAGRGAWAGPVTAAAVILPIDDPVLPARLAGVNDSKKLSAPRRERLRALICEVALAWCVAHASSGEIDALGIVPATRLAMLRAVHGLGVAPDGVLIDALALTELPQPQHAFHFADAISLSVAAASILAKTARDALMIALARRYPAYRFDAHKGYGAAAHARAIRESGMCALHRRSFRMGALRTIALHP